MLYAKILWYSKLFRNLSVWCYRTAVSQFVVFLFFFIGVSYLSTLLEIDKSKTSTEFVSKYEKYVVLASSLYMIVPFSFSNIFLFGLFHKNGPILKVYAIGSLINGIVILIVVIGSGIFIAVEGTAYIAYSLLGIGIILELFLAHGAFLALGVKHFLTQNQEACNQE